MSVEEISHRQIAALDKLIAEDDRDKDSNDSNDKDVGRERGR